MSDTKKKILVGMSGGVDSSAAALILRDQGHEVAGLTFELWDSEDGTCGTKNDVRDAAEVCRVLGIPHFVVDFRKEFRQQVMERFVQDYRHGLTPNPCVDCNRTIKFAAFADKAKELGYDYIATGHYGRVDYDPADGRWHLTMGDDDSKDQSYVLYNLTQDQLVHSLFPLGDLSKDEIRAIAAQQGLINAKKHESQDICFVPDGDYAAFIRRHTGKTYPHGPFLDQEGHVLGEHTGIVGYTVGQRRGLGVSSNHGRLYVKQVRPEDNAVVLSDNASLFSDTLTASDVNWIPFDQLNAPLRLRAKIRYRMAEQPCTVEQTAPDRVRVVFDQPQRAVTPGQAVVFYDGDLVVGGGVIEREGA